jgi:hypothetical protein
MVIIMGVEFIHAYLKYNNFEKNKQMSGVLRC